MTASMRRATAISWAISTFMSASRTLRNRGRTTRGAIDYARAVPNRDGCPLHLPELCSRTKSTR